MASPNMNMPIPVPTVTDGPTYAIQEVSCFEIIDSHNHTAGQGVPVPVSGLDINGALPMNTNAISDCGNLNLTLQTGDPSSTATVYNKNGDLYYKNGAGAAVQITSGGSIVGAAGNITGLSAPASASYGASVFVFQSNAGVAANMDIRNLFLRNSNVGSYRMQVSPPTAMIADYDIILPVPPSSTKFMSMDSSGNIGVVYGVDNTTIEISANNLQVKNDAITTSKIKDANVTREKLVAVGQQMSSSCGTFTTTSLTPVAVTNLSVTITTTGRPVMVMLVPDASGVSSYVGSSKSSTTSTSATVYLERTGLTPNSICWGVGADGASGNLNVKVPIGTIQYLDVPSAGTYTYSIGASGGFSNTLTMSNAKLIAYEL